MTDEKAPAISPSSQDQNDESLNTALLVARVADDFRGRNTVILDMRTTTPIVDYFVITSGSSTRQMRAMADEVERLMKENKVRRLGTEGGEGDSLWTLHDFGDVVLHAFSEEGRKLYDLEGLWADAPRVPFERRNADPDDFSAAPMVEPPDDDDE